MPLTYDQFRYAFANAVSEDEAKQLYETFAVPAPGLPLFQAAAENFNPWTEAKVDTENPRRGPMLFIGGGNDHTVPWSITHASYKEQQRNADVTEITKMRGPGTRADHRQRLARGGGDRARLRPALQPARGSA